MEKKKWTTPILIVLVRERPEEGVLLGCKTGIYGASGASPSSSAPNCVQATWVGYWGCTPQCSGLTSS